MIKNIINKFIEEELLVDYNESIYCTVLFEQLNIYLNKQNITFNKNSLKIKARMCLGLQLNEKNYKSSRIKGERVYKNFKFKNINILNKSKNILNPINLYDYSSFKNEINMLEIKINHISSQYLELFSLYKDTLLQLQILSKNINFIEPVEKIKLSNFIIESLNLKQEKNDNYTLNDFCIDFIEYSDDSKNILYSTTIINDYINYTSSTISFNTLTKMLKKYIEKFYPNSETKSYKDKNYYKGLLYKKIIKC